MLRNKPFLSYATSDDLLLSQADFSFMSLKQQNCFNMCIDTYIYICRDKYIVCIKCGLNIILLLKSVISWVSYFHENSTFSLSKFFIFLATTAVVCGPTIPELRGFGQNCNDGHFDTVSTPKEFRILEFL